MMNITDFYLVSSISLLSGILIGLFIPWGLVPLIKCAIKLLLRPKFLIKTKF